MRGYQLADYEGVDLSVAFTAALEEDLVRHLDKGPRQEDLTFAYWTPSRGAKRYTAIVHALNLPLDGERALHGNVAFESRYLLRALDECPEGSGIALLHSHLGPGWQAMSDDDVVAERDRLGGLVASSTGLPVLGLTWGTDSTWSARFWLRAGRHCYERKWASTVRSVGHRLRISYHPRLRPLPDQVPAQEATISVWGAKAQNDIVRAHVGIVGLGSVGSIVAEALSRTGIQRITLIDHDTIEVRNLDRTLGAYPADVAAQTPKVRVSGRLLEASHTSKSLEILEVPHKLQTDDGLKAALDCDVLVSCVDRPWPRHILNVISYSHLIPLIDGGILARVTEAGKLLHVDWRIHTVGPSRPCLYCIGAVRRSDVGLDRAGLLDDPDYLKGLTQEEREHYGRRNVFAFSLSVAAHEVLHLVGLLSGNSRVGGSGNQMYHAYPGTFEMGSVLACEAECDVSALVAKAVENVGS